MATSYRLGPSGGMAGQLFRDDLIGDSEKIRSITVKYGMVIDGFMLSAVDTNTGAARDLSYHGGSGGVGITTDIFQLDNDEYITGIEGRYGVFVDTLRVITNKQERAFRDNGGQATYQYHAPDGYEIVGFHGLQGGVLSLLTNPAIRDLGIESLAATGTYIVALGVIIRKRK